MNQSIKFVTFDAEKWRETASLLLEFNPIDTKKESLFYKKWDDKIKIIKQKCLNVEVGNGQTLYKKVIQYWRDSDSITTDLYRYLRRNYPVPIPYILFFSLENISLKNLVDRHSAKEIKRAVDLADKWLRDIFSKESFYKRNKEYFTRAEVKYFLSCDRYKCTERCCNLGDLIDYFFITKIKANNLDLSLDVFHMFTFTDGCFIHQTVIGFIKFLCNNKKYIKNREEKIRDICDFLKTEYINNDRNFNFENMTWHELKRLSDEWHLENRIANDPHLKEYINTSWKKSSIKDFIFEKDGKIWMIEEITTGKTLYEEGEIMQHCVFSYVYSCIDGYCFIFSVSRITGKNDDEKKIATLEISRYMELIQARGPCNARIDNETADIIKIWAGENKIDCGIYLSNR